MTNYKFNTIAEVSLAIKSARAVTTAHGRNCYPIALKKAIIEYHNDKYTGFKVTFCNTLGLSSNMFYKWEQQHKAGLYDGLVAAVAVSSKAKSINESILRKLDVEIKQLQAQIDLIRQCEALGLKVDLGA